MGFASRARSIVMAAACGGLLLAGLSAWSALAAEGDADRALRLERHAWQGDFDGMVERRLIRVAVPYGRTLFFHDRGRERGLAADLLRKFEEHLNGKHRKALAKRPITVVLIPTAFDQLIPSLLAGTADIAAGAITITDRRREQVDFSQPLTKPFDELVVTGPAGPALATIEDLSGRQVFVQAGTSYHESLTALNARFRAEGRPEAELRLLPGPLEDEDLLDMVNAGLLGTIVVDAWMAEAWAPLLPDITVHRDLALRSGGTIGFAMRKNSPLLAAELDDYVVGVVRKTGLLAGAYKSFAGGLRKARNARDGAEWEKFRTLIDIFRTYGDRYDFDYLMVAAQGYQESRLDQNARSRVGAIGIMQLMPDTGAAMKVGDISQAETNIHAGVKYMDHLLDRYFADATLDAHNRTLFAFAAYNAGPSRINRLRKVAAEQGYDPNVWFDNVERVVAAKVGQEPVTYVRNIYKYYVSYRLAVDAERLQQEAEDAIAAGATP